jgi:serine phosphatase RsbU (regulator of sigma subunit)
VALALARFDPASGSHDLANAGMPDPYVLRPGSGPTGRAQPAGRVGTIEVPGDRIPLGLRDAPEYDEIRVEHEGGDRLLMVSDGMPEAIVAGGEPLGYRRFERLVRRAEGSDPDLWIDDLLQRVRRRTPVERPRDDDWTALLLERRDRGRRP